MKRLALVAIATILPLLTAAPAKANVQPDFQVSPAITEWILAPGEVQTKKLILRNITKQPHAISVLAQKFIPQQTIPREAEAAFNASSWFSVKEPQFILPPSDSKTVEVELRVPPKAQPGGHYATIYFQQLGPARKDVTQTAIIGQVGALAFVTVKGNISRELKQASQMSVEAEPGGYAFSLPLKNTGNTHLLPSVSFVIYDWRGKVIARPRAQLGLLLPYTDRAYTAHWKAGVFDSYTVRAVVTYGENKKLQVKPQSLWNIPWRIVFPVIGMPLFLWFGVYRIMPRWQRAWQALWKK